MAQPRPTLLNVSLPKNASNEQLTLKYVGNSSHTGWPHFGAHLSSFEHAEQQENLIYTNKKEKAVEGRSLIIVKREGVNGREPHGCRYSRKLEASGTAPDGALLLMVRTKWL